MSEEKDKPSNNRSALTALHRESAHITDMIRNDSAVARAMESMRQNMDEIGRLSKFAKLRVDIGIPSHLAKIVEEQNRRWKEIARPIKRLRSGLLIENELTRRATAQSLVTLYARFPESLRTRLDAIQSSFAASAASHKMLFQGFDDARRLRLEELAKPFLAANSFAATTLAETLRLSLGHLEAAQHSQLPALDPVATAAVAEIWGKGDLQDWIRSFSDEMERALHEEESTEQAKPTTDKLLEGGKPRILGFDFWTLFNIILALAMLAYQEWSSSQMEARLSGKIGNGDAAVQKQIAGLQALLVRAMSAKQPWEMGQTQFVVRSRVARIRRDPRHGSPTIAEVFPNQVVTLIGERGKWIHIEYYDWLAEEKRQGWALKKYFVRMHPTDSSQMNNKD